MSSYFITTDNTADFPEVLMEPEFRIINMSYFLDGVLYDGEDTPFLPSKEFYRQLAEGKVSSTSMIPSEKAKAFFEDIVRQGKDILHVSFSSKLSGSYEGYLKAAAELEAEYPGRKVVVIDSKCAASGEGMLCYYALKKRREGASLAENAEYTTYLRDHIGHAFTVDDMYHLYRGGRVSKGAAIVGQAIQMKPVLMVSDEGELIPTNNVIGRKIALRTLVDKMVARYSGWDNELIIIQHADALQDAEFVAAKVKEHLPSSRYIIHDLGPVIGSHCGKGMIALFYLCSDKKPFVR